MQCFYLSVLQATLWSKLFKCELDLGHSELAYNAMLCNPDASRSAVFLLLYDHLFNEEKCQSYCSNRHDIVNKNQSLSLFTSSFTCQAICVSVIHHSFTLSRQAQNLPLQQILPIPRLYPAPSFIIFDRSSKFVHLQMMVLPFLSRLHWFHRVSIR